MAARSLFPMMDDDIANVWNPSERVGENYDRIPQIKEPVNKQYE